MATAGMQMSETALARSQVYGLLATLFRGEPTEALLRELKGPRFAGVFSDLGSDLGGELREKSEVELREELAVEFTRLFLGPGPHISAHESVFVEADGGIGGLWGEKTVEVKRFIEAAGLTYGSDYTGIPDHISVELEFLQRLVACEAENWGESDTGNALFCLGVEKRFIDEHLGRWVPAFCDKVAARAAMLFYREMAGVTKRFLEYEQRTIDEYVPSDQGRE